MTKSFTSTDVRAVGQAHQLTPITPILGEWKGTEISGEQPKT